MQFLGIGYQEILLVFVVMLVVLGPERMPKIAYQIGKAVRTMQGYARVVRDEFQGEFEYFQEEATMIKGELEVARETLKETETVLREEQDKLNADLDDATQSVKTDVDQASQDLKTEMNGASAASNTEVATLSAGSTGPAPRTNESSETTEPAASEPEKPLLF